MKYMCCLGEVWLCHMKVRWFYAWCCGDLRFKLSVCRILTLPDHMVGTRLLNRDKDMSSNAWDMTTRPLMAFSRSFSDVWITFSSLLYLKCYGVLKTQYICSVFISVDQGFNFLRSLKNIDSKAGLKSPIVCLSSSFYQNEPKSLLVRYNVKIYTYKTNLSEWVADHRT